MFRSIPTGPTGRGEEQRWSPNAGGMIGLLCGVTAAFVSSAAVFAAPGVDQTSEAELRALLLSKKHAEEADGEAAARRVVSHYKSRCAEEDELGELTAIEKAAYSLIGLIDGVAEAPAPVAAAQAVARDAAEAEVAATEASAPQSKSKVGKKALATPSGAVEDGCQLMTAFFEAQRKRGRQKTREGDAEPSKRGRPVLAVVEEDEATLAPPLLPRPPQKPKRVKSAAKRVNWSKGEHLVKLTAAVKEWDAKSERCSKATTATHFAGLVGIPIGTLKNYIQADKAKRQKLGSGVGNKSLVTTEESGFLVDVIHRHDRGNKGMSNSDALDALTDLKPDLTRAQARNCFANTIRPAHKEVMTGIVRAQKTTTKRTAITVTQQWRWHSLIDSAFNELRRRNTGVCRVTGKTFGELMAHFILGGDETCLLANDGVVTVLGDKEKKKHEKVLDDSRVSITMYRLGSAAGSTGPTGFLMSGKRVKTGYTTNFLVDNGAALGSSIHMTKTGFMTEAAWIEMSPSQVKGIRKMPVICDNPQWWALDIIDGFGPHVSSAVAMEVYHDAKILLVKEEADSSHVCQTYDQSVAKLDKASGRECLETLRKTKAVTMGVVDQWSLIHVGLACVRACSPNDWQSSFSKVNLDPATRLGFNGWCFKIGHFLQGGDTFKPPTSDDKYALLPEFWHGMAPDEKKLVVNIINKNGEFDVDCVKELYSQCHVPLKDMQHIRICYELAKEHPEQLEMEAPVETAITVAPEVTHIARHIARPQCAPALRSTNKPCSSFPHCAPTMRARIKKHEQTLLIFSTLRAHNARPHCAPTVRSTNKPCSSKAFPHCAPTMRVGARPHCAPIWVIWGPLAPCGFMGSHMGPHTAALIFIYRSRRCRRLKSSSRTDSRRSSSSRRASGGSNSSSTW
jgi:hypothetical protein